MEPTINWVAVSIFVFFFALVTVLGFLAAHWRAGNLNLLHEWGLGGRRFGILITWFLVGGDFYTAYTMIAVPALVFAVGAYGFFALPYTIIVYPIVFAIMPRLWQICRRHEYITAADFVHGRYRSTGLASVVALTGLLATMPYIALQLVGMRVVIEAMGFKGEIPLIVAFLILAVYTYSSGLRAPAMIAFVKDIMIYIVVLAAVIVIPIQLGGYGAIFEAAARSFAAKGGATGLTLQPNQILPFSSLAFGSALAAFMYPHTLTGVLSASSSNSIRWNAILLPAYTVLLGLIALLGYMAIAAGIHTTNNNSVVPLLFLKMFPDWFVGFSFAAIAIGALVPAAIMSIGAANLFTRNFWKVFVNRNLSPAGESKVAKIFSLIVKIGALLFVLCVPLEYAIDLQLLGGIWILQTFPAVVLGLYRTRLHHTPLLVGWVAGMLVGSWLFVAANLKPVFVFHLGAQTWPIYSGLIALAVNLLISFGGSLFLTSRAHEATDHATVHQMT
jgi:SSS family solute:Na+ symporter